MYSLLCIVIVKFAAKYALTRICGQARECIRIYIINDNAQKNKCFRKKNKRQFKKSCRQLRIFAIFRENYLKMGMLAK